MSRDWLPDRAVLLVIVLGLVGILLAVVIGIFTVQDDGGASIPNWAENVLVAVATGALLKLGDAIGALVTLAGGRQVERLGNQLAQSSPQTEAPASAVEAAQQTAAAAQDRADAIGGAD